MQNSSIVILIESHVKWKVLHTKKLIFYHQRTIFPSLQVIKIKHNILNDAVINKVFKGFQMPICIYATYCYQENYMCDKIYEHAV